MSAERVSEVKCSVTSRWVGSTSVSTVAASFIVPSLGGLRRIVVMSFETARNDIALLDDLPWSCIIVDEVHRLKNPRSGTALAYDQFTCNVRFGLTGTGTQHLTYTCTQEGT